MHRLDAVLLRDDRGFRDDESARACAELRARELPAPDDRTHTSDRMGSGRAGDRAREAAFRGERTHPTTPRCRPLAGAATRPRLSIWPVTSAACVRNARPKSVGPDRAPVEQRDGCPALEVLDAATRRGMSYVQSLRGTAEATVRGERLRVAQQSKIQEHGFAVHPGERRSMAIGNALHRSNALAKWACARQNGPCGADCSVEVGVS